MKEILTTVLAATAEREETAWPRPHITAAIKGKSKNAGVSLVFHAVHGQSLVRNSLTSGTSM